MAAATAGGLFAALYLAAAVNGSWAEVLHAILAWGFVAALLNWRRFPTAAGAGGVLLSWAWAGVAIAELPRNLGFSPFALTVPFFVYSAACFVRSPWWRSGILFGYLIYCVASPLSWVYTPEGMVYPALPQAASMVLLQWLVLFVVFQVGRGQRLHVQRQVELAEARDVAERERQEANRERERSLIAREVHDILAHGLTLINLQASAGLVSFAEGQNHEVSHALATIRSIRVDALGEVRTIVKTLHADSSQGFVARITNIDSQLQRFRDAGLHLVVCPVNSYLVVG